MSPTFPEFRMSTFSAKAAEVKRQWWVIDAKNQHLGHVAVKAANLLRGKHKAIFTPHVDTGDFVVVINASDVQIGGNRLVGLADFYSVDDFTLPVGEPFGRFHGLIIPHSLSVEAPTPKAAPLAG